MEYDAVIENDFPVFWGLQLCVEVTFLMRHLPPLLKVTVNATPHTAFPYLTVSFPVALFIFKAVIYYVNNLMLVVPVRKEVSEQRSMRVFFHH